MFFSSEQKFARMCIPWLPVWLKKKKKRSKKCTVNEATHFWFYLQTSRETNRPVSQVEISHVQSEVSETEGNRFSRKQKGPFIDDSPERNDGSRNDIL